MSTTKRCPHTKYRNMCAIKCAIAAVGSGIAPATNLHPAHSISSDKIHKKVYLGLKQRARNAEAVSLSKRGADDPLGGLRAAFRANRILQVAFHFPPTERE